MDSSESSWLLSDRRGSLNTCNTITSWDRLGNEGTNDHVEVTRADAKVRETREDLDKIFMFLKLFVDSVYSYFHEGRHQGQWKQKIDIKPAHHHPTLGWHCSARLQNFELSILFIACKLVR